jgi:hypothetical protein
MATAKTPQPTRIKMTSSIERPFQQDAKNIV